MLIVTYESFSNNYNQNKETKTFENLDEFAKWLYSVAELWSLNKSEQHPNVFFSTKEISAENIKVKTYGGYTYWHFCIEDTQEGIIYTSGKFTYGQKHCSTSFMEWLKKGERGELQPKLKFAE